MIPVTTKTCEKLFTKASQRDLGTDRKVKRKMRVINLPQSHRRSAVYQGNQHPDACVGREGVIDDHVAPNRPRARFPHSIIVFGVVRVCESSLVLTGANRGNEQGFCLIYITGCCRPSGVMLLPGNTRLDHRSQRRD